MKSLWVLGSGGHAAVIIDSARATGQFEIVGCLDDDPVRHGQSLLGVPVVGSMAIEELERLRVVHAVIAIGNNAIRRRIAERLGNQVHWASIVHPRAYIGASVQVGAGAVIMAGAIVQPNTSIGEHVIVNTAASIDHDGWLGAFSHVGPGSHLAGNVSVGEGAQLGTGCIAIPGVTIGEWSLVGAGAVVTRDLPAHVTAIGVPAQVIDRREP